MAYQSKDLSVLAYANGFTLWHYCTTDKGEDVANTGYFDRAVGMFRSGDMLISNLDTASDEPQACILLVTKSEDGAVTVAVK